MYFVNALIVFLYQRFRTKVKDHIFRKERHLLIDNGRPVVRDENTIMDLEIGQLGLINDYQ